MGGHLPEAILHPTCEGAKLAMNTPLLERYLREWRLRLDGPLLESHSSWLQPARQLGRPVMLKLLKDTSDEQAGADVLRYFAGNGAVRLIAADPGGVLMERADDDVSLRMMALSGGDDRAAGILAGCVRRLHAPRECAAPDGLTPLRDWFRSLFAHEAELPILARCADVARCLLAEPREVTVLHGDLHHDNVLHGSRGWLAIDPKGLCGERSYKVANLLGNPWPHGEIVHQTDRMLRLSMLYASRLDLDPRRVLGFALAHAGLSASWSLDDGGDPSYRLTCAALLDPLVT
jgi:streptomycin 6-kinase